MRIGALIFLLSLYSGLFAQQVVDVGKTDANVNLNAFYTVGGTPFVTTKYVRVVSGTPYFSENWMRGKLELSSGRIYDSQVVRLDLLADELHYLGRNGEELVASTRIKRVSLTDTITGAQYNFIHSHFLEGSSSHPTGWYQLLENGKAALYKKTGKLVSESRPYGSATIEQSVKSNDQYFVSLNGSLSRVKKINELPELLGDRKEEIGQYIADNKLNGKKDAHYMTVIAYYNKPVEK